MNSSTTALIHHEGPLTAEDANALLADLRHGVETGACPKPVFLAFVELVQNLRIHGDGRGGVTVRREDDVWVLRAWNQASPEDAERALQLADHANSLGPVALRQWIHDRRLQELPAGAKGAGLGLAVMRRLSCSPLEMQCDAAPGRDSRLEITLRLAHKDSQ